MPHPTMFILDMIYGLIGRGLIYCTSLGVENKIKLVEITKRINKFTNCAQGSGEGAFKIQTV